MLEFEWDPNKAAANLRKHGVNFEEAITIFADFLSLTFTDPDHSQQEERLITIGLSEKRRLLVVIHTDRLERIRIISARVATRREILTYEHEAGSTDG